MHYDHYIRDMIQRYNSYRNDWVWEYCGLNASDLDALKKQKPECKKHKAPFECSGKKDFWFRILYKIPAEIMGIKIKGGLIRLNCAILEPLEAYINGKRVFRERF